MNKKLSAAVVSFTLAFSAMAPVISADEHIEILEEQIPENESMIVGNEEADSTYAENIGEKEKTDAPVLQEEVNVDEPSETESHPEEALENELIVEEKEQTDVESKSPSNQASALTTMSVAKTFPDEVTEGDTTYFLNEQGNVIRSKKYEDNRLVGIKEYYSDATLDDVNDKVKYQFNIDPSGYLVDTTKFDEMNQKVTTQYQYYPQTEYGSHGDKILYRFYINSSGFVTSATKNEKGSQRVLSRYQYYPSTEYGQHGDRILYIFDLDGSEQIIGATKREERTKRILSRYQYYPQTVYGKHGNNIKYVYDFDSKGYITGASKREKGTKKILSRYQYYPKTVFGKHGNNILYIFDMNSSGHIKAATKREQGTKRILSRYQYYPKTAYGKHGNNILYIFDLDSSGNISGATKRAKGTKAIVSRFEYYPKTAYGKHGNNIKYIFDVNSSGYLSKATLREKGTKKVLVNYQYLPGTTYGNHNSKINSVKLNVPLVSQLPELPTGCEITAVTMMLQYKGANVNKVTLAKEMPKHGWDPNYGYVGDPFTRRGWTIHPPALTQIVKKYAGSAELLTGRSNSVIEKKILNQKPVVVWVSPMHGFTVHALALTGYDQNNYYFNDPWTGEKDVKMSKSQFNKIWGNQDRRAISY
ncbi:MAG: C39 family peptidase [Bacillota bacterium]